jgi:SAM-dependent methyltransferase
MGNDRRLYSDLSWTWPIISPPEDYADEARLFTEAIEKTAIGPVKTLLDLGCGGGHNDFHLKRRFEIVGVDISDGMLDNARRLNPDIRYQKGDMRTARLGSTFDCVIIADSIMYMLTEEDMLAAFTTAFEHLRPGGVFCTYVEQLPDKFVQATTVNKPGRSGNMTITFIEHIWDPDSGDTTFELLFIYLINEGNEIRLETDRHTCGLFPIETWMRLLKQVGFNANKSKSNEPGVEYFITCQKPTG